MQRRTPDGGQARGSQGAFDLPRSALFVFTPGFQSLGELSVQYRRLRVGVPADEQRFDRGPRFFRPSGGLQDVRPADRELLVRRLQPDRGRAVVHAPGQVAGQNVPLSQRVLGGGIVGLQAGGLEQVRLDEPRWSARSAVAPRPK